MTREEAVENCIGSLHTCLDLDKVNIPNKVLLELEIEITNDINSIYNDFKKEQGSIENTICKWKREEDDIYETSCKNLLQLTNDATLSENGFKFCTYCGGEIELKEEKEDG